MTDEAQPRTFAWTIEVAYTGMVQRFFFDDKNAARRTYGRIAKAVRDYEKLVNRRRGTLRIVDDLGIGQLTVGTYGVLGVRLIERDAVFAVPAS